MAVGSHYASGRFVALGSFGAICAGTAIYFLLPDSALDLATALAKNMWTVLGVVGAFCIQLLLQLVTVGEDRALTARQQGAVIKIVDQRMRYLWDLTGVALLSLAACVSADAIHDLGPRRLLLAFAVGATTLTAILAMRLPMLFLEIRNFRWRLARERNQNDAKSAMLAALKAASTNPLPDVPEAEERDD